MPFLISAQNSKKDKFEIKELEFEIDGERPSIEYRNQFSTHVSPISILTFLNKNVYHQIGSPPEYFDTFIFKEDINRVKRYLYDHGYFQSIVDTNLIFNLDKKTINILIKIDEGNRTKIDSIIYNGIDSIAVAVKEKLFNYSLLQKGIPFEKNIIDNERQRILNLLYNSGYRLAIIDSISVTRFTSGKGMIVKYLISPYKQFNFGKISINNENSEIDSVIIYRQLEFSKGELYQEEKRIQSEINLNRLGVFQNAQIQLDIPIDTISPPEIPLNILLRAKKLRDITPEIILNDEKNVLNTGFGLGFDDKNFIGGARNFSINTRLLLHSIQELDFKNAIKNGVNEPTFLTKSNINFNLTQPYLFSNKSSASISFIAEYEKQKLYSLTTLQTKFGVAIKLSTFTNGFIDWYLERIAVEQVDPNVDISGFTGKRQKQFNSIISFTLQKDKTNNLFSPTSGYFHSINIEEAGLLPQLMKEFSEGLPFTEYLKINFNLRHFYNFSKSESFIFAWRLRGGSAYLYNSENKIPLPPTRKFYLGGSSSMRAWKARSLATFQNPYQGGNTSLEFSTETRYHFANERDKLAGLEVTKFWGVLFLDFGNLWDKITDVNYNSIAIAGGVGLRYDTFIGPVRLDFAWRVYDPSLPKDKAWISQKKFFKESFNIVQIGIGHPF